MKITYVAIGGAVALGVGVFFGAQGLYPWLLAGTGLTPATTTFAGRLTVDPELFEGKVREAYEVAQRNPGLLARLHCYCGCDRKYNHKSLLDCFRDMHGSTCEICIGEARDGQAMASQGLPIEQIRDTLRAHYSRGE